MTNRILSSVIVAGLFTASAIHGNNTVNACIREQTNYESEMASRTPLPDMSRTTPKIGFPASGTPNRLPTFTITFLLIFRRDSLRCSTRDLSGEKAENNST